MLLENLKPFINFSQNFLNIRQLNAEIKVEVDTIFHYILYT